jgi:hypothetical protein
MFKRIRWIGLGMAAGAAVSVWSQRKAKDLAARYRPAGIAGAAFERARAAVDEGRRTMRQREAELREGMHRTQPPEPAARQANPSVNGHGPK